MNFICGVTLLERITQTHIIVGLILAAVGLALSLLAKRITIVARKNKDISPNDNVMLIIKALGLVMILVALIVMMFE